MTCHDRILLDDWHVVSDMEHLQRCRVQHSGLFEHTILIAIGFDGEVSVTDGRRVLPGRVQYGFVWTCIGSPERDIIHVPEACEEDRLVLSGGSFQVRTSGLRVVENFLDMGHFPFVHTGWPGEEPHIEAAPCEVELTRDNEIVATKRFFHQPAASPTAEGGIRAEYKYRVYRPYIVALYKTNPLYPDRMDYIVLFIQPLGPEDCVVHNMLCYIKEGMNKPDIRWFMQMIFGQDKPITGKPGAASPAAGSACRNAGPRRQGGDSVSPLVARPSGDLRRDPGRLITTTQKETPCPNSSARIPSP